MATKTTKVTTSGNSLDTLGYSKYTFTESKGVGANEYTISPETLTAKITLRGSGDTINLEGSYLDYSVKWNASHKSFTLVGNGYNVTLVLKDVSKTNTVLDTLVFEDGEITVGNVPGTTNLWIQTDTTDTPVSQQVTKTLSLINPVPPEALTNSATDMIFGSVMNDFISGQVSSSNQPSAANTLHASDMINGRAGYDTFILTATDGTTAVNGFEMAAVEKLQVRSQGESVTLGMQNVSGLETFESYKSQGDIVLNGVEQVFENIELVGDVSTNTDITINYDTLVAAAGDDDTTNLLLERYNGTLYQNDVENINIETTGYASAIALTSADNTSGVQNITWRGNQNLNLTGSELTSLRTAVLGQGGMSGDITMSSDSTLVTTVQTGTGNDTITLNGAVVNNLGVSLSSGNNILSVTNAQAGVTVSAADGNDNLTVDALGDVSINAANGTNTVSVVDGDDVNVITGTGNDAITIGVNSGDKTTGNANVTAGAGTNTVNVYNLGTANVTTGEGNDTVVVHAGLGQNVTASVGNGTNIVTVQQAGQVSIVGGSGSDTLTVGTNGALITGNVYITGGDGTNTVVVDTDNSGATVSGGSGVDTINIDAGANVSVSAGAGANNITVGGTADDVRVTTTTDADTIVVGSIGNRIDGSATIDSGAGNDSVTLYADADGSVSTGEGDDTINANSGTPDSVQNVTLNVVAGNGNNSVTVLDADHLTITSGTGNDSINVGASTDQTDAGAVINAGAGNNTINAYTDYGQTITTTTGDDIVTIDSGLNDTYEASYNDVVDVGAGNNTVTVLNSDNITITSTSGNDTITVGSDVESIDGMAVVRAGDGDNNVNVYAELGVSVSTGSGADTINAYSAVGDISISSGAGNDRIQAIDTGADGNDVISVNASTGDDWIRALSSQSTDRILVDAGAGDDYVEVNIESLLNVNSHIDLGAQDANGPAAWDDYNNFDFVNGFDDLVDFLADNPLTTGWTSMGGGNTLAVNYSEVWDSQDANQFDLDQMNLEGSLRNLMLNVDLELNAAATIDLTATTITENIANFFIGNVDGSESSINSGLGEDLFWGHNLNVISTSPSLNILSDNDFGDDEEVVLTTVGVTNLGLYADDDINVVLANEDMDYDTLNIVAYNEVDSKVQGHLNEDLNLGSVYVSSDDEWADFEVIDNRNTNLDLGSLDIKADDEAYVNFSNNDFGDFEIGQINMQQITLEERAEAYDDDEDDDATLDISDNELLYIDIAGVNMGGEFADNGEDFIEIERNDTSRVRIGEVNVDADSLLLSIVDNDNSVVIMDNLDVQVDDGNLWAYNGEDAGAALDFVNNDDSEIYMQDITVSSGEDIVMDISRNDSYFDETEVHMQNVSFRAIDDAEINIYDNALTSSFNDIEISMQDVTMVGLSGFGDFNIYNNNDIDLSAQNVAIYGEDYANFYISDNDGSTLNFEDVTISTGGEDFVPPMIPFGFPWAEAELEVLDNDNSSININGDLYMAAGEDAILSVRDNDVSEIDIVGNTYMVSGEDTEVTIYNNDNTDISIGSIDIASGAYGMGDTVSGYEGDTRFYVYDNDSSDSVYSVGGNDLIIDSLSISADENIDIDVNNNDSVSIDIGDLELVAGNNTNVDINANNNSSLVIGNISSYTAYIGNTDIDIRGAGAEYNDVGTDDRILVGDITVGGVVPENIETHGEDTAQEIYDVVYNADLSQSPIQSLAVPNTVWNPVDAILSVSDLRAGTVDLNADQDITFRGEDVSLGNITINAGDDVVVDLYEDVLDGTSVGTIDVVSGGYSDIYINGSDVGNVDIEASGTAVEGEDAGMGILFTAYDTTGMESITIDSNEVDSFVVLEDTYDVESLTVSGEDATIIIRNTDDGGSDTSFRTLDASGVTDNFLINLEQADFDSNGTYQGQQRYVTVKLGDANGSVYLDQADAVMDVRDDGGVVNLGYLTSGPESREIISFVGNDIGDVTIYNFSPSGFASVDGLFNDRLDFSSFTGLLGDSNALGALDITVNYESLYDYDHTGDDEQFHYEWDVIIDFDNTELGSIYLDDVLSGSYRDDDGSYYSDWSEQDVINLIKESIYFG